MIDPRKKRYLYSMLSIFGAIGLSILLFFFIFGLKDIAAWLGKIRSILSPFIYGGVVAYLLRPMCNFYETFFRAHFPTKFKKAANPLAVGLSLITGILIVYTLIIMIAPQIYGSAKSLWISLPDKISHLIDWLAGVFGEDEALLFYLEEAYRAAYAELDTWVRSTVLPNITNLVSGVGMGVLKFLVFLKDFLVGIIVAAYLLGSRKRFGRQSVLMVRSVFPAKWADMILEEVAFIDRMFGGFIDGKIVDSAIIGVLCYIGCLVFKFPNALLVSAIVGITNVIPFFGPFIGAIPSILLILIESPIKAVWFSLFILGLQQLDGNVIGPKILGDRTGLSSFWVLFSIILFGGLWGLVGMVVCVPFFAVIYDIIRKLVRRGLAKNERFEIWEQYKADYPDEEPTRSKKKK